MTLHLWYLLIVHVLWWLMGGWLWFTFFCKILPRSHLRDASLRHPSSVAIDREREGSRRKRVSKSISLPEFRATTTRLNRSLSALMATVLSLPSETGTEYKVSKVFNFCCFKLSWNCTSFLINLTWTSSFTMVFPIAQFQIFFNTLMILLPSLAFMLQEQI